MLGLGKLTKPWSGTNNAGSLEYLRRDAVIELALIELVIGWLAALRALRFDGYPNSWPVALILITGGFGAILLRHVNFRVARYLFIVSLMGATAFETWAFPGGPARYYFPVVLVMSSLLVSHAGIFVLATLAAGTYGVVAWVQGVTWEDSQQVINVVILTYLTALAVWLASRQLHLALAWMENSYDRARTALDQLREQRVTLARTLKALEQAYDRIERMNYVLVEARSAAEEARRLKAEFAANISHELRTPLNLIIGFSETMANAPETYGEMTWPSSLRGDVEQIYRSSGHLSSLIDDILDLSALDAHRLGLTMEEVDIGDIITEAVSVVSDLFQAKGLYLKVDLASELPRLRLDSTRIRQVLLNLLNNASRFTSRGGVVITVSLINNRAVQVALSDTGVGIAPEDVPKVFEEFRQIDGSTRRDHEGTGLGIPLSKRLIEFHGGRMWLESTPGQGSTFYFTLPLTLVTGSEPSQEPVPTLPRDIDFFYRKGLLVFEPDPLLLRMLRRYIDGYDIIEIRSQNEFSALVDHHQPIAMLVDGQSEVELEQWFALTGEAVPDLPLVTLNMRGSLGSARMLGVHDYLLKPVERERLLESVRRLNKDIQTLLIVDDDPELVDLLSRMLQSTGRKYRLLKSFGGEEALARMALEQPDLVLLDLTMPDLDGVSVLKKMRASDTLADISVIVISAREYAEIGGSSGGQWLNLGRPREFSMTEMLANLQALLDALPLRVPTSPLPAPEPRVAPFD